MCCSMHEDALECYGIAVERCTPDMTPSVLSNLGLLFQDMGEHDSALAMFSEALQAQPDNVGVASRLGGWPHCMHVQLPNV